MDLFQIRSQIINKKLETNVFLFYGEELEIINIYIQKIKELFSGEYIFTDNFEETYSILNSESFLEENHCVVLFNCEVLKDKNNLEILLKSVKKEDILIIVYCPSKPKEIEDFLKFNKLPSYFLVKHIKEEINLSEDRADLLCFLCNNDWGRIRSECDKILCYLNYRMLNLDIRNFNAIFDEFYNNNIIHSDISSNAFDICKTILNNDYKKAWKLIYQYKIEGNSGLLILGLVYSTLRRMLAVKGCPPGADIEKESGLTQGQVYGIYNYLDYYSAQDIIRILNLIKQIETGIKWGKFDDSNCLEYLLIMI